MPGPEGSRTRRRVPWRVLGGLLLAGSGVGCASNTAPEGWLPAPEDAAAFPHGAWVTVERKQDGKRSRVDGELIALRDASVIVLAGRQWIEIPRDQTRKITATYYKARLWPLSLWSTVGTLSSLSHGWGLIVSAPLWIVVGTASTAATSHEPREVFPKASWEDLRRYARFPQGVPPGIDGLSSGP
jgi:hypothetical protein